MNFEEIIQKDGFIVYTNVGVSMMPLIRENKDLIYIKKIEEPLKFFDAVLFKRPNVVGRGQCVLHRILKVNKNNTYFIMGDNDFRGEIVKQENIIGILSSIKRQNKEIKCDNSLYKLFIYIWYLIFPLRAVLRLIKKVIRKLFK